MTINRPPSSQRLDYITFGILCLLAAILVAFLSIKAYDTYRHGKTIRKLAVLADAIQMYYHDIYIYPSAEEGLAVLVLMPEDNSRQQAWQGPYARTQDLTDPWGHAFVYQAPNQPQGHRGIIGSFGKDGKRDGTGMNQDIYHEI